MERECVMRRHAEEGIAAQTSTPPGRLRRPVQGDKQVTRERGQQTRRRPFRITGNLADERSRLSCMRLLAVMISMALVVGACGGDALDGTELTAPEGTPGDVILEISDEGGFVPVEFNLTSVPRFTVFADGTVVLPGDQQFSFPGPALRPLVRTKLDSETLTDLLIFVADLGLADIDEIALNNAPNVADASTTVVRYFDDAGEHRISIYALGFDSSADARSAIVESMIAELDEATTDVEPYPAERLVVFAQEAHRLDPEQLTSAGPWPFDFDRFDGTSDVAGFWCVTIEGAEANVAAEVLSGADSMTTWELDGVEHRVIARPLLPHQDGC